jgi:hypothetical protein
MISRAEEWRANDGSAEQEGLATTPSLSRSSRPPGALPPSHCAGSRPSSKAKCSLRISSAKPKVPPEPTMAGLRIVTIWQLPSSVSLSTMQPVRRVNHDISSGSNQYGLRLQIGADAKLMASSNSTYWQASVFPEVDLYRQVYRHSLLTCNLTAEDLQLDCGGREIVEALLGHPRQVRDGTSGDV